MGSRSGRFLRRYGSSFKGSSSDYVRVIAAKSFSGSRSQ